MLSARKRSRTSTGRRDHYDNEPSLPIDTLDATLKPEDYFPHYIAGARTLVDLQWETKRLSMKDGVIKGVHGADEEVIIAEVASKQVRDPIDHSIEILRSQLAVAEQAKDMLTGADKAVNETKRLKNTEVLDPAEYDEDVISVFANKIDFEHDCMWRIKKDTGFHSLDEIQKVEDRQVLIKFLSLVSKCQFERNPEFVSNMDALKASGIFWRPDFPIHCVLDSSSFNLLTSQWLIAMYLQASGYLDFPTGTKFETQNVTEGVSDSSPWSSSQPTS